MNETEIIKRAVEGDDLAFEQIVKTYEKKVYGLALRYTNNADDAMDISQDVFFRVYRFLPKFSGKSSLSTWIYRITMNVCHDTIAKRSPVVESSLDIKDEEGDYQIEIPDRSFDPVLNLEKKETRELIMRGVSLLDENYRQVLLMRDIGGQQYDEIANTLGINIGTVKSRISRGRERLRQFLIKNGNFSENDQSNISEKTRKEKLCE